MKKTFRKALSLFLTLILVASVFPASTLIGAGAEICTVSFDADGGVFPDGNTMYTVKAEYGSKLEVPEPTLEGHTFCGWYPYAPETVEDDATYYATWEINEYTITYIVDGEVYEEYPVWFGDEVDMPADPYFDDVRIFLGWSETEGGDEIAEIPEFMPSKNLTYYAVWEQQGNIITGVCGDNLTWSLNTDTGEFVISGTGDMYDVEPAWIDYLSIIKSVNVEEGATSIGEYAFFSSTALTEVSLPDGLKEIGEYAFHGCSALTDISIPDSVETIGNNAFESAGLTSIAIPEGVKTIGAYAFDYCSSLETVSIPDTVTDIGDFAFRWCFALKSITVDAANTSYSSDEYGVLFNKDKTKLIQYPVGNERTSYTIPESVTELGDQSFSACSSLKSMTVHGNIKTIGHNVFEACKELESVTIEDGVLTIGSGVFASSEKLTDITIADSVKSVGNDAFYKTGYYNDNSNWENNILYIGKFLVDTKYTNGTSCIVKDGTTVIAQYAFANFSYLREITLPESLTDIGNSAFYRCYDLTDVYYKSTEEDWAKVTIEEKNNECLLNAKMHFTEGYYTYTVDKNGNATITDVDNGIPGEVIVPETLGGHSVTAIGWMAFEDCDSMWKVIIAGNVTNIDDAAFVACDRLDTVVIGDSVTDMGAGAFDSCHRLTSVTIGENVKRIGEYTFYYCTSLTSIVIPDSVTEIGWNAFEKCTGLKTVIIGDGVKKISRYAFNECNAIEYVSIGSSVSVIELNAFSPCYGLKEADYNGTRAEWDAVEIYSGNGRLELLIRCIDDEEETTTEPTTVPVVTEPSTTEPTTAPVVTEPSTTEPTTVPVVTEPSTTEPTTVPVVTEPSTTEPTTVPVVTEPSTTEPTTAPVVTEPSTTEPTTAPVVTEPSTTEPTTAPDVTKPSTTEPTAPEETKPSETKPNATVSIKKPSITTVKYGDTLILHAEISGEIPEGSKLVWSVDGEGFTIKPSADGKTCAVTSTANGEVTVTVKLVDANGEAVSNSSGGEITAKQELASKAGFFRKIISFFKNLFRMNRVIEQVFKFVF